jgi:hypothetical protein
VKFNRIFQRLCSQAFGQRFGTSFLAFVVLFYQRWRSIWPLRCDAFAPLGCDRGTARAEIPAVLIRVRRHADDHWCYRFVGQRGC